MEDSGREGRREEETIGKATQRAGGSGQAAGDGQCTYCHSI